MYADDTETSVYGSDIEEIKAKLEEDGTNVLKYTYLNQICETFLNLIHCTNVHLLRYAHPLFRGAVFR